MEDSASTLSVSDGLGLDSSFASEGSLVPEDNRFVQIKSGDGYEFVVPYDVVCIQLLLIQLPMSVLEFFILVAYKMFAAACFNVPPGLPVQDYPVDVEQPPSFQRTRCSDPHPLQKYS